MITGKDIYQVARELVGTPYVHQGRKKNVGIDCIGVPIWVCNRLGLGDFDRYDYSRLPDGKMLEKITEVFSRSVSLDVGVLLVFKIRSVPSHCGIVSNYKNTNALGLIHAWEVAKKVTEDQLTSSWMNRIVGCFSLPGIIR